MLAPARFPVPARRQRPRRFALGLLLYFLLTVATFWLVYRYAIRVAALYGYDIQQKWLQFGLYFLIYLTLAFGLGLLLRTTVGTFGQLLRREAGPSGETLLRLTFLVAVTLDAVVALYQARFGNTVGLNYFLVGGLGSFAGVLAISHRWYGLIEVISAPSAEVRQAVEQGHRGLAIKSSGWDRVKRGLDAALALVVILISLPISVPLAVLSWLSDPGPLLVAKVAVKRGGKSFQQLKLRTMVKGAERDTGPVPAAPLDARVTRLGSLLRRTHIDELPQMLNIARGDMSLVGPRPERTVFVRRHLLAIPGYARRHAVRPGLAGLAQVCGDYYSTPREKLAYDLLYVRRRGLRLDAWLLATAVLMALFGIQPKRRTARRRAAQASELDRWRRAWEALRGDSAPALAGSSDGQHPAGPQEGAGAPLSEHLAGPAVSPQHEQTPHEPLAADPQAEG